MIDRGALACGTTGAGEGNILVSDKEPGPELDLALLSLRLWHELGDVLPETVELEPKGGLVVASTEAGLAALVAAAHRSARRGRGRCRRPGEPAPTSSRSSRPRSSAG